MSDRLRQAVGWRVRLVAGRARALKARALGMVIGKGTVIGRSVALQGGWRVKLGADCRVEEGAQLKCPTGQDGTRRWNIVAGDDVFIGKGSILDSNLAITVGDHTFIAPYCFITDTSHLYGDLATLIARQGYQYKETRIGRDVWIGAHTVVVAGVEIGDGCVVGANSTVTKSLPPYSVAVGSPARVIKARAQS